MVRCLFGRLALLAPATLAAAMLSLIGCDPASQTPKANGPNKIAKTDKESQGKHDDHEHGDDEHEHHHHGEKGPHGGALVAVGGHDAHVEVLVDAKTGKVTAWILDGAAEKSIAIKQKTINLAITVAHEHEHGDADKADEKANHKHEEEIPETEALVLTAVSPAADGAASEFAGQSDVLKGLEEFDAAIESITIAGKTHKGVEFNYPEGNEHDHHH